MSTSQYPRGEKILRRLAELDSLPIDNTEGRSYQFYLACYEAGHILEEMAERNGLLYGGTDHSAASDYITIMTPEDAEGHIETLIVRVSAHQAHHGGFDSELRLDRPDSLESGLSRISEEIGTFAEKNGVKPASNLALRIVAA